MAIDDTLDRGRESFGRRAWGDAFTQLSVADHEAPLEPEDLELLATAAYLIGRDADSEHVWARAHHEHLSRGHPQRAVRCGLWLAFGFMNRGEMARGGGWLARAARLLDDGELDCVERGYLLVPIGMQNLLVEGDGAAAYATFSQAAEIGDRFDDPDLAALAQHGRGQAMIMLGEVADGMAVLDEVMVAVTAGEVSPILAGTIYCGVIDACQEMFDLRRAQEWTAALNDWCATQPDLVPYRGQCLVYRAELMQFHGRWSDAMDEAQRARERLSQPPGQPAVGMALFRLAELHRLRGEFGKAKEAYREANQWGRNPQPGLALLRLAEGEVGAAESAIRHVVDEAQDRVTRSKVLSAYVEIMLAANDTPAARIAVDELSQIAQGIDSPLLHAVAAHALGAVALAEGDARAALASLRQAWTAWQELEAPYEAGRVRVLIGLACRQLGDADTAEMELDAARWVFRQLGAAPDLALVEKLLRRAAPTAAGGLTAREVEVLRLVSAGKTNRAIADELVISEKTVARHVSNIFTKLGLSSRSAATSYAYQHDLV